MPARARIPGASGVFMNTRLCGLAALLALAAAGLSCGLDPCNGECPSGQHCDAELLACVPDGADAGPAGCTDDSGCGGATPRCYAPAGRCVQCLSVADCPGGRCDALTRTCVAAGTCTRAEECAAVPGKPYCASEGVCVQCRVDGDCPAGEGSRRACDRAAHACVDAPCTKDQDCSDDPAGHMCDIPTGKCVLCTADDACIPGRCHPTSRTCVDCVADADCNIAGGETCDTGTNTCKVTGCAQDVDCSGMEHCDPATHKCSFCARDADCTFGGECRARMCADKASCAGDGDCVWPRRCEAGACVACRADLPCAEGQSCVAGACAEPAACTQSASCRPGRACVAGACAEVRCTADGFEPDDTAGTARPILPGTLGANLCPNEQDWYALPAGSQAGAQATLRYDPARPAPALTLMYDTTSPAVVATGAAAGSGTIRAVVEQLPSGRGPLLVRVAANAEAPVAYTLQTVVNAGGVCADDTREPDNSYAQSPTVRAGPFSGTLCPMDSDWLAFDVPAEMRPVATLQLSGGAAGVAVVEIWTQVNGSMRKDAYGFTSASASTVAGSDGQKFWVAVKSLVTYKLTYALGVELKPKPPANDACNRTLGLAPNASTTGTTLGATGAAQGCGPGGGDVFYVLTLGAASKVTLGLVSDFQATLALSGACGAPDVACVSDPGGTQQVSFDGLPAGNWIVRVDSDPGQQGHFTIQTDVQPADVAPAGSCETPETIAVPATPGAVEIAGNLALGTDDGTSACGSAGRDAVWGFTLAAPAHVTATLRGFPGASLSLATAADCASPWASCVAVQEGAAVLERMALGAGDWRLRVDGASYAAGRFGLRVDFAEPVFPPGNDACDGASELLDSATDSTRGAMADFAFPCAGAAGAPDAVYRLTVAGGDKEVSLQLSASFDAVLAVTGGPCGTGTVLACSDGPAAKALLPALAPGDYFVWVGGYRDAAGAFSLSAHQADAAPAPANESCEAAETVDLSGGPQTKTGATLRAADDVHPATCTDAPLSGPDVVYAVAVPAGKALKAVLHPLDFDGALYVAGACGDAACLGGADASLVAGGAESVRVANSGADAVWFVVVDSWRPSAAGHFSLEMALE